MLDNDFRDAMSVEDVAGLLGVSYRHMSKLIENDRVVTASYTAPILVSRAELRRERLNQRLGFTI